MTTAHDQPAELASRTNVLGRVQVLRCAPTPLRGAPSATWTRPARIGTGLLSVAGWSLQPSLPFSKAKFYHPADSTLATPVSGPEDGVHLTNPGRTIEVKAT